MLILFIRTILIYFIVIAGVRLMGKRQIGDLQTTELVVTLLISDLAAIPMQDSGQSLFSGLLPIFILVSLEIILSIVMLKSGRIRKLLCGSPVIIIYDGKILQKRLKDLRMSTEDLFEALREKDVFSLNEVKYAIIETNGKLSLMKNEDSDTVTNKALGIEADDKLPEAVVISDGEIQNESLKLCEKSSQWLYHTTEKAGFEIKDIFIMTADRNGNYNIIEKDKVKKDE